MNSGGKIPLKNEIFKQGRLVERVKQWLGCLELGRVREEHRLKQLPAFIHELPEETMAAGIVYSIKKRLPGLLEDS